MLMHIKRNESLFHLKIKTYLKRIILLHNTNIASHSLLIRKLKYIQKMPLNTKNTKSLSLLSRKVKLSQSMRLPTTENTSCSPQRQSKTHGNQDWTTSWTFDRRGEENFCTDKVCCCYPLWKSWSRLTNCWISTWTFFTRIQHWHWLIFIVVQQILVWQ